FHVTGVQTCALPISSWHDSATGYDIATVVESATHPQGTCIGVSSWIFAVEFRHCAANQLVDIGRSHPAHFRVGIPYIPKGRPPRSEERRVGNDRNTP